MKNIRQFSLILLVCMCVLIISSCEVLKDEKDILIEDGKVLTKLKVYMVGDELQTPTGSFFFTTYALGEMRGRAIDWGEKGHIYYEAIRKFEENSGMELEVICFNFSDDLFAQLEVDRKNGTMPDVIVADSANSRINAYKYLNSDYFVDLNSYLQEKMDCYYERVLECGELNEKQYIMPLIFNMNVLFSSNDILEQHDVQIYKYESYSQICDKLIELLRKTKEERSIAAVSQLSNHLLRYPYVVLDSASGVNMINYETGKLKVDEKYIGFLYDFEKARLEQEFGAEWEKVVKKAKQNENILPSHESKSIAFQNALYESMAFGDIYKLNIILLEGGGHTTVEMHSALAQGTYMNSKFKDLDDKLVYIGIPSYRDSTAYTANVTMYAGITTQCEDVEAAFRFIECLADYDVPWQLGFSINIENTEQMIQDRRDTIYTIYPYTGLYDPMVDPENDENYRGEPYSISVLDDSICEYFLEMLDNIGTSTLPDAEVKEMEF